MIKNLVSDEMIKIIAATRISMNTPEYRYLLPPGPPVWDWSSTRMSWCLPTGVFWAAYFSAESAKWALYSCSTSFSLKLSVHGLRLSWCPQNPLSKPWSPWPITIAKRWSKSLLSVSNLVRLAALWWCEIAVSRPPTEFRSELASWRDNSNQINWTPGSMSKCLPAVHYFDFLSYCSNSTHWRDFFRRLSLYPRTNCSYQASSHDNC